MNSIWCDSGPCAKLAVKLHPEHIQSKAGVTRDVLRYKCYTGYVVYTICRILAMEVLSFWCDSGPRPKATVKLLCCVPCVLTTGRLLVAFRGDPRRQNTSGKTEVTPDMLHDRCYTGSVICTYYTLYVGY